MPKACLLDVALVTLMIGLSAQIASAETETAAGVVTAVSGTVTVNRASASPQALKFRDALFWRDVVEARKDGIARVLLGGKTTVTVRELSRLELREETLAEGARYTVELVRGKVRASVARMLMRPRDQVEVRTRNAVASVRGTDFIVEMVEQPAQRRAFGLLGMREVAQGLGESPARTVETVIITLSGVVEASNRLAGPGHTERVNAYQAVRVSGMRQPLRVDFTQDMLRQSLSGLTPPRPQPVKGADASAFVSAKVEQLTATGPSTNARSDGGALPTTTGAGSKGVDRSNASSLPEGQKAGARGRTSGGHPHR